MVVLGFSWFGRWCFDISESKPSFSSKPQVHLRPSLSNMQKQTSAGIVPSVSRVRAVGFATQR